MISELGDQALLWYPWFEVSCQTYLTKEVRSWSCPSTGVVFTVTYIIPYYILGRLRPVFGPEQHLKLLITLDLVAGCSPPVIVYFLKILVDQTADYRPSAFPDSGQIFLYSFQKFDRILFIIFEIYNIAVVYGLQVLHQVYSLLIIISYYISFT